MQNLVIAQMGSLCNSLCNSFLKSRDMVVYIFANCMPPVMTAFNKRGKKYYQTLFCVYIFNKENVS
ncbi:hypothetical protein Nmel_013707 [Mimus melanotis]